MERPGGYCLRREFRSAFTAGTVCLIPSHLLGVEVPVSIYSACLLTHGTGVAVVFHTVDFVVRTTRDRIAGQSRMITYQSPGGAGLDLILLFVAHAVATYPLLYRMGGRWHGDTRRNRRDRVHQRDDRSTEKFSLMEVAQCNSRGQGISNWVSSAV
jgi:hypothetical protein